MTRTIAVTHRVDFIFRTWPRRHIPYRTFPPKFSKFNRHYATNPNRNGDSQSFQPSKFGRGLALGFATAACLGTIVWYNYQDTELNGASLPKAYFSVDSNPHEAEIRSSTIVPVSSPSLLQQEASANVKFRKRLQKRDSLAILTPDEITDILQLNAQSNYVDRNRGVVRFDVAELPSNSPIEDEHCEKLLEVPSTLERHQTKDWMFWGIYDGHAGWATAAKLRQALVGYVYSELEKKHEIAEAYPTPESIDAAIKTGFNKLDHEITWKCLAEAMKSNSKPFAVQALSPAIAGSCALLAFYDTDTQLLRVACTGDSRAVLGRKSEGELWSAVPLSVDQTGYNKAEVARINAAHPGEKDAVKNGRVLGYAISRAFGDGQLKWTRKIALHLRESFYGRSPSAALLTPPYATAEPIITTTKIEPENGDFVVMASDGLWESLTNDEVVGLVGKWIKEQKSAIPSLKAQAPRSFWNLWKLWESSQNSSALPVVPSTSDPNEVGQSPFRPAQWGLKLGHERFVVKDGNVATHLMRNALGGSETDITASLLTLSPGNSRRFRDDLTITVIFFGKGEGV